MTLERACGVMWVKVLGEKTSEEWNYEKLNKKGQFIAVLQEFRLKVFSISQCQRVLTLNDKPKSADVVFLPTTQTSTDGRKAGISWNKLYRVGNGWFQ